LLSAQLCDRYDRPFARRLKYENPRRSRCLGNPVRFILTVGQVHDVIEAKGLIDGFSFENLLADKLCTQAMYAQMHSSYKLNH
jgi:hypothetical protein